MGQSRGLWPVLLALLIAVVLPTACVLWFMNAAVRNERLAVRQKLEMAYQPRLTSAAEELDAYWRERAAALSEADTTTPPAQAFAQLVTSGLCDSAVLYDATGQPAYPAEPLAPAASPETESEESSQAQTAEYEGLDFAEAAALYGKIAESASDAGAAACALQAEARCLAKAGQKDAAIRVLSEVLSDPRYRDAVDAHGRLVAPNALLFALELTDDSSDARYSTTLESLVGRLTDYGDPLLPSPQRRFLMRRLQELAPDCPPFPTLAAEELAAEYLQTNPSLPLGSQLLPTPLEKVWRMASADKTVVALFREESVLGEMQTLVASGASLPDADLKLLPPSQAESEQAPFLAIPAGQDLPGWRVALYLEGSDPFAAAADRQITAYLWTGMLVIALISIVALLVGRFLLRQARLTRLKNDFIATVSHELKTPLSSMRVLVDTLLEGKQQGQEQTREYLQLVARENERLSRLIDNFLTFSRMERNKRTFEFEDVEPAEVIEAAVEATRGKFEPDGRRLEVEIAPGLPAVAADRDALVTVLMNLLDNAHKYSGKDGHVALRAYEADGEVCFEVQDNGIGMTPGVVRKIFNRFYQADRNLSRTAGGCGLGLSIVKFIVDAHGGSIDVKSQPGKGSTFTVRLPTAAAAPGAEA